MKPELLLPAGSLEKMNAAFSFGADAVYAGQPRYSLRARNNEFGLDELNEGILRARILGKKFYVASNLMPHNAKVKTYLSDMEPVIEMGPDALIMADPGLIMMAREKWPDMPVHLSVQANTVNYASVRFWKSFGLSRVILSRELSLQEIAEIRENCPDTEIEVFVHGALCIAYSGRCLLSGYFNHRDPNQGTCTNSCRWDYKVYQEGGEYLIEESKRPGELMPIFEDEHGTYIMNSKDLRAVEHVSKLVEIGVDSLKVEGRTKSIYYVARTAQVYRRAIDDAVSGRPFDPGLLSELEGLANRGYTDGFYERHHTQEYQNYMRGHSESSRSLYVGDVGRIEAGMAEISVKNRFQVGDRLEVIHPEGNRILELSRMENERGESIACAPGAGHKVYIPLEAGLEYAFLARFL